jgi:hypothetical protein
LLYLLYLLELPKKDRNLHFGYADDFAFYQAGRTLNKTSEALAANMRLVMEWSVENKVFLTPKKCEAMHFARKEGHYNPDIVINGKLIIILIPANPGTEAPVRTPPTNSGRDAPLGAEGVGAHGGTRQKGCYEALASDHLAPYDRSDRDRGAEIPKRLAHAPDRRTQALQEGGSRKFRDWEFQLTGREIVIYLDGPKQSGETGYGYVIYRNRARRAAGLASLDELSEVFDAEATGAWRGLERALKTIGRREEGLNVLDGPR